MHLQVVKTRHEGRGRRQARDRCKPKVAYAQCDVRQVPLAQIDLRDARFRFRLLLKPESLVDSVRSHGIQIPLIVRRGTSPVHPFQLVCGFRRAHAAALVGLDTVPAMIRDLADDEAFVLSYTENDHRKTLSDLDRANAIAQFLRAGKTIPEVAHHLRLSDRQVQHLKGLLDYPAPLRAALEHESSGMQTTHAIMLMHAKRKHGGALHLVDWIEYIRSEGPSVCELKAALREQFDAVRPPSLLRCRGDQVGFNLKTLRE